MTESPRQNHPALRKGGVKVDLSSRELNGRKELDNEALLWRYSYLEIGVHKRKLKHRLGSIILQDTVSK